MSDKMRKRLYTLFMRFFDGKQSEDFFQDAELRRFYRKLYFEAFRHLGFIDKCIKKYVTKDPGAGAKAALVLGITQVFYIDDVPDYAAVNEAVNLVRGPKRGLVNAVMRKVIADKDELLKSYVMADDYPQWMVERWNKRYGKKSEQYYSCLNDTPLTYAVDKKTLEIKVIEEFDENEDGLYYMDKASSLIPALAGNVRPFKILDCCAAPGGKTFILSKKYPDAQIFAVEKNHKRFETLKETVKKLGLSNVVPVHADIMKFEAESEFDLVLLDAPCSALGTMRKHPEVRWLRKPNGLKKNSVVQKEMLDRVSSFVGDGGVLIYSVCTFEPEETTDVVVPFLDANNNFSIQHPECPDEFVGENNYFVSEICKTQCDGFFAAVMKKL